MIMVWLLGVLGLIALWLRMEGYADAIEDYGNDVIDRVLDTMGRDVTAIVANHTLGGMSDEAFKLLMDYLSKYDAMLRDEV